MPRKAIMTSHFDLKLDKILSEMPIRHFKAFSDRAPPSMTGPQFHDNTIMGYTSPKFMATVSEKLSRLSGFNINIFVIEGYGSNNFRKAFKLETLSKVAGVPVEDLNDAINFVITGNNRQMEFSPWLYMHQLGEAINTHCSNARADDLILHFKDSLDRLEELVPDWKYRLKMGSARKAKATGEAVNDLLQEIITEYLWHGGRIRFDYPDDIDKNEIDEILGNFKATLEQLLNGLVGRIITNDIGE
jgi:hypothetical protein